MASRQNTAWGTDGVISMPQPLERTDVEMADLNGFVFTPDGIRVNMTAADRDDVLIHGYGPVNADG